MERIVMTTKDAEKVFLIKEREIRKLCKEKKIKGVNKIKGKYDIPDDTVMIITDEMARAFLYQLLKYKNNPGIVISSAGCDDEQKVEIWRDYLIDQGLTSKCDKKLVIKDLLDSVQLTDKGLQCVFGKANYKALINLKPEVNFNIGFINI